MPPSFSPAIFKAYDIRGVVPQSIDRAVAQALGLAFAHTAREAGETTVAVGRDGRLSSPQLAQALVQGLLAGGVNVVDIGPATTPMLYFAASTLCASGIQVTGSHNPRDHNGFKMVLAGRALYGEQIQTLRQRMAAGVQPQGPAGSLRTVDIWPAYRDRIVGDVVLARPLTLVVDAGNGIAGATAPALFRALGCEVHELHCTVDGQFPNHHPDPSRPENLRELTATVQATGADLGFAFDGDGDRLGVVTPSGQAIAPDRQLMLFARDVLTRHPGAAVVFDVKCSQRLAPAIRDAGGVPVMHRTGHSLIKARMRELHAPLGGEMSGHLFFADRWYGFDDGSYAGARLLEIVATAADPGALLQALPDSHATPELNLPCAEGEPHRLVAQLQELAQFAPPAQVSTIDGVRVDWPDGFGLVRASNTTPVLVLRFEGHSPEALARIQGQMLDFVRRVRPGAELHAAGH